MCTEMIILSLMHWHICFWIHMKRELKMRIAVGANFTSNNSKTSSLSLKQLQSWWSRRSWPVWQKKVILMLLRRMISSTWRERRWSRPRWWWRTQWGGPWCLQWGWAGPPSWSPCLSRCRRRLPCQSRSGQVESSQSLEIFALNDHVNSPYLVDSALASYLKCLTYFLLKAT